LVVDNNSNDATRETSESFANREQRIRVRYLFEDRGGKSAALNRAVRESFGEILLFIDDDVQPASDWLIHMCEPILRGQAGAVQGRIVIAPHLRREWMNIVHTSALAEHLPQPGDRVVLIGANMAVARRVFDLVPAFDEAI